jgi:hypothetical protein
VDLCWAALNNYRRLVPVTTMSTSRPAPGTNEPRVPIEDRDSGTVTLGELRGIWFDLPPGIVRITGWPGSEVADTLACG